MPIELQIIRPVAREISLNPDKNPYFVGIDKDGDPRIVASHHEDKLTEKCITITKSPKDDKWSITTLSSEGTRVYVQKGNSNEDRILPNHTLEITPDTKVTIARDILSFQLLNKLQSAA